MQQVTASMKSISAPPRNLEKHILRSYSTLRWAMAGLGLILPPFLVFGGINEWWWLPSPLAVQDSLSAYYHAVPECTVLGGVYRDLFVGFLAAISACLIIYSGFGKLENWLLNLSGFFLLGVAFFPTAWPTQQLSESCVTEPFEASQLLGLPVSIHAASAVLFFISITAVNLFTAMDVVEFHEEKAERIQDEQQKRQLLKKVSFWKCIYRVAKFLMPISIGSVLLLRLLGVIDQRFILWIEWFGIWAFSIYWVLKSIEILRSDVDIDILKGKVERNPISRKLC